MRLRSQVATPLRHLRSVSCSFSKVTDAGLCLLGVLAQELRDLDVSWSAYVTNVGLASMLTLTTGLQNLNLSSCTDVTDAGFACVAALAQLQHLDLTRCNITDAGIACVVSLHRLQRLVLSSCAKITDTALHKIGGALRGLRHLDLSRCHSVTDNGVAALETLHRLQHLCLLHCANITDMSIASVAKLQELQHLDLRGCVTVTDVGMASLASLHRLQLLMLTDCRITDSGLACIAAARTAPPGSLQMPDHRRWYWLPRGSGPTAAPQCGSMPWGRRRLDVYHRFLPPTGVS